MGSETLATRRPRQNINEDFFNDLKKVLAQDHFPRRTGGFPVTLSGSFGTADFEWLASFIRTMNFGVPAQGCSLSVDGSGDVFIKRNSLTVGKFDNGGLASVIKNATIDRIKFAARGQQISSSCGAYTTFSTSYVDVTNLTLDVTTEGRPVFIMLMPNDNTQSTKRIVALSNGNLRIMRDAVELDRFYSNTLAYSQGGGFKYLDHPSSGTYTYKIQARNHATNTFFIEHHSLVIFKL